MYLSDRTKRLLVNIFNMKIHRLNESDKRFDDILKMSGRFSCFS